MALKPIVLEPREHTRAELATLLWPEIGDQSARANLRNYAAARIGAFRASVAMMLFFAFIAQVLSLWLPKRKLVETTTAASSG